ncbi:hypothetical protein D3C81_1182240 [compost metagenome]
MLLAHNLRVHLARGRVERVHCGVDTESGDVTRQHQGRVQVQEGGCRRRVGQVIRRHVDGLDRRNRASLGRRNTLLQLAHFFSQRRLVAHGGRHTAQQRRHFGTSQRVAVDVVDEEQDVTAFVAELLGDGQAGKCHAQTVARRLVHLAEHHGHLVEHVGVLHFVVEVVPFTGTLAHAGKHRQTAVLLGDVVDELHHVDGLAHASATEQAHLAALGERADQVDHLDAGFQQVGRRRQFVELRCLLVNRAALVRSDRASFVDGATQHVHDAAQRALTHRHRNRRTGVLHRHAAAQAVRRTEGNGTDHAVTQLLLDFERQALLGERRLAAVFQHQRVVHLRHCVARELDVHHGANALHNISDTHFVSPIA